MQNLNHRKLNGAKMSKTIDNKKNKDWYVENFKTFEGKLNGQSKSQLHEVRKNAIGNFKNTDFPTTRNEEWKYTDVSQLLKHDFIPAVNLEKSSLQKNDVDKYLFNDFESYVLVFVNGIFSEGLSNTGDLPNKVKIDNFNNAAKENPDIISKYINKLVKDENAFNTLNTAYAFDGLFVYVPDGVVVEKPVQVLYLNTPGNKNILSTPRNLIVAGKNSQIRIINNYVGLGENAYFTNVVTEVFVDEFGIVELYKIQNENENSFHIEKVEADQKKNSLFNHFNLTFGGALVRNDINTVLDGEFIETHYYGLTLANGKQHVDNHTFVDHAKPNCMSNELYKGILDDNARNVFNGKIIVRRDAQKTNAYQQNKTVLLSKTATIDTKPQLEIFADDVKCSHGATVGHLDEVSEFYIRSRGVPQELAKSMLIRAFANDVIESVKIEPLKERLNHMIFEHLHKVEIEN